MTGRPRTAADKVDRTGREEQVTGRTAPEDHDTDPAPSFGIPGTPGEEPPEGHENDFA